MTRRVRHATFSGHAGLPLRARKTTFVESIGEITR
jgi:hypothetical protein